MGVFSAKKSSTSPVKTQETKVSSSGTHNLAISQVLRGRLWLKRPHISEKTARGEAGHQYTFMVDADANKALVKNEVERFYKVDVIRVNITRLPAKSKQWMRRKGMQSIRKKAIVTLKDGQKIEIM